MLPDILAADLGSDNAEDSNCLWDVISLSLCTAVFMLELDFGAVVLFPIVWYPSTHI